MNDPILTETKQLLKDEETYTQKLANLDTDKQMLPKTVVHVGDMMKHIFELSTEKLGAIQNVNGQNSSNTINANILTTDYEQYVTLRKYIQEQKYFDLSANMTSTKDEHTNAITNTLVVSISADTIKKAQEEKEKEEASKSSAAEDTKDTTTKETSTTTEEASK